MNKIMTVETQVVSMAHKKINVNSKINNDE